MQQNEFLSVSAVAHELAAQYVGKEAASIAVRGVIEDYKNSSVDLLLEREPTDTEKLLLPPARHGVNIGYRVVGGCEHLIK